MLISDSRFDLVWFRLSCDHGWIRSGSVNVRKQQQQLYYTILYYSILYYTILYYTILYYIILYYTILYYTILYYIIVQVLHLGVSYILVYTIELIITKSLEGKTWELASTTPTTLFILPNTLHATTVDSVTYL